ncbi:response regulator [uncultured Mucilaginibacter sp.]|uniref:response regulator n=1 Tax=uncultured Mucilaginibacter sp. TaxID=797541 RepID=UPI0025F098AA|nr:response regulator [uncultured Mucilaginibacter sp.]
MSNVILICDDDAGILNMLNVMLDYEGYDVVAVDDSSEIKGLIEQRLPDIIIIDLWMPTVSGYDAIKAIKANPDTSRIPIVAISASPDGRNIAMEAGANEFITKPFDIYDLIDVVNRLLVAA